jgi:hypothetical protein
MSLGLPRFILPGGRHFITSFGNFMFTHTHTHTHIYIYIYIPIKFTYLNLEFISLDVILYSTISFILNLILCQV